MALLIGLYLLPLVAFEIAAQLVYAEHLGTDTAISRLAGRRTLRAHGLQLAHTNKTLTFRYLYDWRDNDAPKTTRFQTDAYGTIEPSSLTAAQRSRRPYVLFCGGSTTEGSFIQAGHRIPDRFALTARRAAVNAGRSGKDIHGCIQSIAWLTRQSPAPSQIVIANNVNTLMTFAEQQTRGNGLLARGTRALTQLLPGSYQVYQRLLDRVAAARPARQQQPAQRWSDYEQALDKGCCHGAARFNRQRPELDWERPQTLDQYRRYVGAAAQQLRALLNNRGIAQRQVVIVLEPNSYGLPHTAAIKDWRQKLHAFGGRPYSSSESALISNQYDNVYQQVFVAAGFRVLRFPPSQLEPDDFYDAVHLTTTGARKLGDFYAANL